MTQYKRGAFTLAEVLIALALLGVIAAFAIPKILQSSQDQQKRAVFKETIATLHAIEAEGRLSGQLIQTNLNDYFRERLNTLKTCDNSLNEGCWIGAEPKPSAQELAQPGWLLSNGVTVTGFANAASNDPNGYFINGFLIDWNGLKPPNTIGNDQLFLLMCYGRKNCTNYNLQNFRMGQIIPIQNIDNHCNGTCHPDVENNKPLYDWIMQN